MSDSTLQVDNISVRYGRATALESVSIAAAGGEVTGVIGPNGAGKSSLIQAIYGSVHANGSVRLDGMELSKRSAIDRAKSGIALVPQGRQVFARLTVRENLQIMSTLLNAGPDAIGLAMNRFPILKDRANQLAGVLSGGEQQMLSVARALMGAPSVLLLDEVMTGLAPKIVEQLSDVFRELKNSGITIVIADPSANIAEQLVDSAYILIRGKVLAKESGSDILVAYQSAMGVNE